MDRKQRRQLSHLRTFGRARAVRWDRCKYDGNSNIHVTICADRGAPFHERELARLVCDSVECCSKLREYRLYGFCLMPDHLHTLLSPGGSGVNLGQWLDSFKSFTFHEYVKLGGTAPLWQRSAHDHVCRDAETAENVLRYIVNNPVRRGLATHWREWEWTRVFIEV
ncbi:MAG TPA: transposase [Phycisphaerae bacterium]|nr:transposase [Phycisphaerae bacterium]